MTLQNPPRAVARARTLPAPFRRRLMIWIAAAWIPPLILAGAFASAWT